jgi:hypothetical protein
VQGVAIDVTIIGWQLKHGTGEVWLVRVGDKTVEIPFSFFSLLDDVQIPADNLCNKKWQCLTYIERDFTGQADWLTFTTYNLDFSNWQAASLWALLGGAEELCVGQILGEKKQIEVCKTGMKAMSRRAEITELVLKRDIPGAVTLRIQFL